MPDDTPFPPSSPREPETGRSETSGATDAAPSSPSAASGAIAPGAGEIAPEFPWFLASASSWFCAFGLHQTIIARLVVGDLQASDEVTGTVQAATMAAGLALLFVGGAVADRVDARRMLIWTHLLGALPPLALALAVWTGELSIPLLVLCAMGLGALNPFCFPSREAMCWQLGSAKIERAVTAQTMVQFGSQALGMRVVDVARTVGSAPVLLGQAFVVALGAIAAARLPAAAPRGPRERPSFGEMLEGLKFVWRTDLRWVWILVFGIGLFFGGAFWTAAPLMLRERFGSVDDLGALLFGFQLGTMVGSSLLLWRGGIRRKGFAMAIALLVGGGMIILLGQGLPFLGMQLAIFAWGLTGSVFMNMNRTLFQARAPEAQRARVLAMNQLGFMAAGPIGAALAGFLSGALGPANALVTLGCAMLALVATVWIVSPVSKME